MTGHGWFASYFFFFKNTFGILEEESQDMQRVAFSALCVEYGSYRGCSTSTFNWEHRLATHEQPDAALPLTSFCTFKWLKLHWDTS